MKVPKKSNEINTNKLLYNKAINTNNPKMKYGVIKTIKFLTIEYFEINFDSILVANLLE